MRCCRPAVTGRSTIHWEYRSPEPPRLTGEACRCALLTRSPLCFHPKRDAHREINDFFCPASSRVLYQTIGHESGMQWEKRIENLFHRGRHLAVPRYAHRTTPRGDETASPQEKAPHRTHQEQRCRQTLSDEVSPRTRHPPRCRTEIRKFFLNCSFSRSNGLISMICERVNKREESPHQRAEIVRLARDEPPLGGLDPMVRDSSRNAGGQSQPNLNPFARRSLVRPSSGDPVRAPIRSFDSPCSIVVLSYSAPQSMTPLGSDRRMSRNLQASRMNSPH
jgi:hypothetical protein